MMIGYGNEPTKEDNMVRVPAEIVKPLKNKMKKYYVLPTAGSH